MCLWLIRFIDLFCKIPEYLLLLGMFPFIFRTCLNNCSYVSCLCINRNPYALCIWEKQIEDLNPWLKPTPGYTATPLISHTTCTHPLPTPVRSQFGKLEKVGEAIRCQLEQPHSPAHPLQHRHTGLGCTTGPGLLQHSTAEIGMLET